MSQGTENLNATMPYSLPRTQMDFNEQVIEMIGRTKRSRAGSSTTQEQDTRVTELINGLLVSKPAKRIIDISETIFQRLKSLNLR
jgi:hypothetical protein